MSKHIMSAGCIFGFLCPEMTYEETILLMRELFKYRDVIDYTSYIYIITTTHKNKLRIKYEPSNNNICGHGYEITNILAKRYMDATISNDDQYATSSESTIIPRAILLFDKNNTCRYVEVSMKLLSILFKKAYRSHYFDLGNTLFWIDASYDSTNNKIHYPAAGVVPVELIPFISRNTPSLDNIKRTICTPPPQLLEYIEENLSAIKQDLMIEDEPIPPINYKYISIKNLHRTEREKRRAQLMEELRQIDEYSD